MSILLTTFIIGISLSMDAFSLALVYGTVGLSKKQEYILAIIVGLFHFFMPLIGLFFGGVITRSFAVNINLLVAVIFGVIGLEMVISSIRDDDVKILISIIGFLLFGLSVSIDSFTTGIGLNAINNNYLQVSSIFAMVSGLFTYIGLRLGVKLNERYGKYATFGGGIMLIILGIYYIFR